MEIMIVDDEPQVAEVLARSLSRQGHHTTVVHSGQEALDLRTRCRSTQCFSTSPCQG